MTTQLEGLELIRIVLSVSPPYPGCDLDAVMRQMIEKVRSGEADWRLGVNDCLEMIAGLSEEKRRQIESQMVAAGLHPIADFQAEHSRSLKRIIKRGEIVTEMECCLAKGVLDRARLSDETTITLSRLLDECERSL